MQRLGFILSILYEGGSSPRREGRVGTSIWYLFPWLHICSNLKLLGALLKAAACGTLQLATGQRSLSFSFRLVDIRRLIFRSRLFGKFNPALPVDVSSVICETDQSYRFRQKYIFDVQLRTRICEAHEAYFM